MTSAYDQPEVFCGGNPCFDGSRIEADLVGMAENLQSVGEAQFRFLEQLAGAELSALSTLDEARVVEVAISQNRSFSMATEALAAGRDAYFKELGQTCISCTGMIDGICPRSPFEREEEQQTSIH